MADRRSTSKRSPPRSSMPSANPNVFSDDYALEEYEPVADGPRPMRLDRAGVSNLTPTPQRTSSVQQALESPHGSVRRSRLSQRSIGQNSNISRFEDGASRQSVSDLANAVSTPNRSTRTISTFTLPRAQSPYQGPTGPSQPYGMYSQDVSLARSPSTATTSTIRPPERAYSGPGGPTQPYGMYAQNTVPEDDGQEVAGMAPAMPGFPGIAQPQAQAIRRLGPDGEDADDIIGPDGHVEQLPPYSRYANGIPPKVDTAAASFVDYPPPESQPQWPQEMAHAGPSSYQAGPSEYYRPEPREVVPASPPITVNPFDDSSATLSSSTAVNSLPSSEKGSFKDRVKQKGNRRVCCGLLPCWSLAFVVIVLCVAVLLGGIVGGVVAHHAVQKNVHPPGFYQPQGVASVPTTVTTTTLADASPITATPSNLPALPTGSFNYVLNNPLPGQNSNSCLPTDQNTAWDCANTADLSIVISMGGPHSPLLSIGYTPGPDPQAPPLPSPQIRYGAQPPVLPNQVNLNLMRDKDEWNKGPAYFFQQAYNKTVIVKEHDLPTGYQGSKRSKRSPEDWSWLEKRQSDWVLNDFVSITDKPWYCFWNGTILEGFIYVTQNEGSPSASNAAAASSFATATSTPMAGQRKRQAGEVTSGTNYPKVIKLEERRPLRNPPQPYCQQMQILNNGQPGPLAGASSGQPIIFNLTETEPLPLQQNLLQPNAAGGSFRSKEKRQPGPNSNCMCEWQN